MKLNVIAFLFVMVACSVLPGCFHKTNKINPAANKAQMMKTDEAFSGMSGRFGMKKAFIDFMDNDGVLLRPGHMPIIGADAIEFLMQADDTAYTLTWKPSAGDVSSAGDLGFTYGIYSLQLTDTVLEGTYVSIWKKQPDGKWKFILDTGNEGINTRPSLP